MGQRTQILVIKESKEGKRNCTFMHNQWGYGRQMYLAVIDLFMQDYNRDKFITSFLEPAKIATNDKFYDVTDEVPSEVLEGVDPEKFETIKEVFEYGDNNNGGCVIYMKEREITEQTQFKIGFLLGQADIYDGEDESCYGNDREAFARWLSPSEYGRMNGGNDFSDEDFTQIYRMFCKYFEIESFTD